MSKTHFADIHEFNPRPGADELVVLQIDRVHVERNDLQTWVSVLERLSSDEATASAYEGMLSVAVTGYEDDPRELYEVPEVVRYMRALTDAWPYWFHFCERNMRSLELIFLSHVDLRRVKNLGPHKVGVEVVSEKQFKRAILGLFNGMNALYEQFGWSEARNIAASDKVNDALMRWAGC